MTLSFLLFVAYGVILFEGFGIGTADAGGVRVNLIESSTREVPFSGEL